ncbi:MAG TPA: hypothetical protein VGM69_27485 [Chloroflexota bacterium]|jgi:hypothetical protein
MSQAGAQAGRSGTGRRRPPRPRRIVGLEEAGLARPASDRDAVAVGAAEQPVDRHAERLPDQVEESPPETAAPATAAAAVAPDASSLSLSSRDRALIAPELSAFASALARSSARQGYQALLEALDRGSVEGEPLELLGSFLELGLSTGRFRARLGPHAEEAIRRVFERTPRGAALATSAAEVTKALERLTGQTLTDLRVSLVRPGTYRLLLETDQYRISLGLAPAGAHVESVELQL